MDFGGDVLRKSGDGGGPKRAGEAGGGVGKQAQGETGGLREGWV